MGRKIRSCILTPIFMMLAFKLLAFYLYSTHDRYLGLLLSQRNRAEKFPIFFFFIEKDEDDNKKILFLSFTKATTSVWKDKHIENFFANASFLRAYDFLTIMNNLSHKSVKHIFIPSFELSDWNNNWPLCIQLRCKSI